MNATHAACLAHASLGGYLGLTLARRATTPARRCLSRCLIWFALYATIYLLLGIRGSERLSLSREALASAQCVMVGVYILSCIEFFTYARWFVTPIAQRTETILQPSRWLLGGLAASVAGGVAIAVTRGTSMPCSYVLCTLGTLIGIRAVGRLARTDGRLRGRAGMTLAAAAMFAPLLFWLCFVGAAGADRTAYGLVRDVSYFVYVLTIFLSFLDHAEEPMSIEARIVAGTLTPVLAVLVLASRIVEVVGATTDGGSLASERTIDALVVLMILSVVAVVAATPSMFRRSLLFPISRLSESVGALEQGRVVALPVLQEDEIGRLTRSFNSMATSLDDSKRRGELHVRELETLNEELRRQVAARSRQLPEILSTTTGVAEAIGPGALLDGRYRIESIIGTGGMGVVYAATRITDLRPCAVKLMARAHTSDDLHRFSREAEIAASLVHDHLVGIFDVGVHRGLPFLVMDRINGGSLADAHEHGGDTTWMLPLLGEVADGLAALHSRGILHRDLKPANVLLHREGDRVSAKIADFGIARDDAVDTLADTMAPGGGKARRLTRTGVVMGTLPYLAPELMAGVFSHATDVFAFGVMAYEVLTGREPFATPPIFAGDALPAPPMITMLRDHELGTLLASCVEARPERRPSAAEIASAFRRAAGGLLLAARRSSPQPSPPGSPARLGRMDDSGYSKE